VQPIDEKLSSPAVRADVDLDSDPLCRAGNVEAGGGCVEHLALSFVRQKAAALVALRPFTPAA